MIRYLVIILDDSCPSFCYYSNKGRQQKLISLENLKNGVLFGMKNNLNIQVVFPDRQIPDEYYRLLETTHYSSFVPSNSLKDKADVILLNDIDGLKNSILDKNGLYVVSLSKESLFSNVDVVAAAVGKVKRLNVFISDIPSFSESDFERYKALLSKLSDVLLSLYLSGLNPQLNILTDRISLNSSMNNCGAGDTTVTMAPDGNYYICPAFYYEMSDTLISTSDGYLDMPNGYLFKLSHAPICKKCDAFQCKRCIWMNVASTNEVNTPGHEQCVVSHLERNASRELLTRLKGHGIVDKALTISEINYLDPLDIIIHR